MKKLEASQFVARHPKGLDKGTYLAFTIWSFVGNWEYKLSVIDEVLTATEVIV